MPSALYTFKPSSLSGAAHKRHMKLVRVRDGRMTYGIGLVATYSTPKGEEVLRRLSDHVLAVWLEPHDAQVRRVANDFVAFIKRVHHGKNVRWPDDDAIWQCCLKNR